MTSPVIASNDQLAERARTIAGKALLGSAERAAALCCAVALGESRSAHAARKILAGWDGPPAIRAAALELLGQLAQDVPAQGGAAQEGTT